MTDTTREPRAAPKKNRRVHWLKQLHQWHWISSAIALIGLLLFTITGITLNHASEIETTPVVTQKHASLPAPLRPSIAPDEAPDTQKPLPGPIAEWVERELNVPARGNAEWTPDEITIPLPRPGGDGWVAIDRVSGETTSESTDRGWISYLNDLHKGRNAGPAWGWFIDVFALACVVFTVSGLFLLQLHARQRRTTWPWVGLGLVIPLLLALIFIH